MPAMTWSHRMMMSKLMCQPLIAMSAPPGECGATRADYGRSIGLSNSRSVGWRFANLWILGGDGGALAGGDLDGLLLDVELAVPDHQFVLSGRWGSEREPAVVADPGVIRV